MDPPDLTDAQGLERFRDYLKLLVRLQFGVPPTARIDPSDLVQQTLMEAFEKRAQFRGNTDDEQAAWLRTMLARNVDEILRAEGRLNRDVNRERSLDEDDQLVFRLFERAHRKRAAEALRKAKRERSIEPRP